MKQDDICQGVLKECMGIDHINVIAVADEGVVLT